MAESRIGGGSWSGSEPPSSIPVDPAEAGWLAWLRSKTQSSDWEPSGESAADSVLRSMGYPVDGPGAVAGAIQAPFSRAAEYLGSGEAMAGAMEWMQPGAEVDPSQLPMAAKLAGGVAGMVPELAGGIASGDPWSALAVPEMAAQAGADIEALGGGLGFFDQPGMETGDPARQEAVQGALRDVSLGAGGLMATAAMFAPFPMPGARARRRIASEVGEAFVDDMGQVLFANPPGKRPGGRMAAAGNVKPELKITAEETERLAGTRWTDPKIYDDLVQHADLAPPNPAAKPSTVERIGRIPTFGTSPSKLTKAQLEQYMGISDTSKMIGSSFSTSAGRCRIGGRLQHHPGTVCSTHCYALMGQGAMPQGRFGGVSAGQLNYERNFRSYTIDPAGWREGMTQYIKKAADDPKLKAGFKEHLGGDTRYPFRWFDSGDVNSPQMLDDIIEVAAATPEAKHWLPTKEFGMVSRLANDIKAGKRPPLPTNMQINVSVFELGGEVPKGWRKQMEGVRGINFSVVVKANKDGTLAYGHVLPKGVARCPVAGADVHRVHQCVPAMMSPKETKDAGAILAKEFKVSQAKGEAMVIKQGGCDMCWHGKAGAAAASEAKAAQQLPAAPKPKGSEYDVAYNWHSKGGQHLMAPGTVEGQAALPSTLADFKKEPIEETVRRFYKIRQDFNKELGMKSGGAAFPDVTGWAKGKPVMPPNLPKSWEKHVGKHVEKKKTGAGAMKAGAVGKEPVNAKMRGEDWPDGWYVQRDRNGTLALHTPEGTDAVENMAHARAAVEEAKIVGEGGGIRARREHEAAVERGAMRADHWPDGYYLEREPEVGFNSYRLTSPDGSDMVTREPDELAYDFQERVEKLVQQWESERLGFPPPYRANTWPEGWYVQQTDDAIYLIDQKQNRRVRVSSDAEVHRMANDYHKPLDTRIGDTGWSYQERPDTVHGIEGVHREIKLPDGTSWTIETVEDVGDLLDNVIAAGQSDDGLYQLQLPGQKLLTGMSLEEMRAAAAKYERNLLKEARRAGIPSLFDPPVKQTVN